METAIQLDLFDFEDTAPVMELPTLESLQKPQEKVQIIQQAPEKVLRNNYRISPNDVLVPTGAKHKIAANIEAIHLLKELEESNKSASNEELQKLIRYSGWGGIPQVFDPGKAAFSKEYAELKAILSNEEYTSARASTLNSHYTPKFLIEFMWKIAEKTEITKGEFGEFGAGIGHFIGMMPEAFQGRFTAVEIDDISGRIMKQLYPRENVIINNLQQTFIKRNSLDLVIGNVPFDQVGVHDSDYVGYNLHNYFIGRALDALKPGGFAILLTSASTMDSKSPNARSNFASRAALTAAIRLPNSAFAEIGTEVVADILVFQKGAVANEKFLELQNVETGDHSGEMRINEYFANHPEMILGTLSNTGKMYGHVGSATVLPLETPLAESLTVPELTIQEVAQPERDMFGVCDNQPEEIELDETLREYTLFQRDGRIWQYRNHKGVLFTDKNGREFSGKERRKIEHFIDFKESLNLLLQYQLDLDASDELIEKQRTKLNHSYDFHIRNFGNLNKKIMHRNMQEDPDYLKLAATENICKKVETSLDGIKTHRLVYEKGDIYFKRTQHPWREPDHADDIVQAGMISYGYRHQIDIDYMAAMMKLSKDDALAQLLDSGEFFENPVNGKIELRSEYLSGNVVRKLEIARETAPRNVKALEAVQPPPLRIEDIDFQLGSFWIPPEIVQSWLEKTFSIECQVSYPQAEDKWYVTADYSVRYSMTEYQVADWDLFKLVECALNLKEPIVNRKEWDAKLGEEKLVVDQEATLTARQYKNELQDKFRNYVMDTPDTVEELENIYNSIFNSHVTRQYELPAFDIYPGAVGLIDGKKFVLRTHQKRAVSRCIEGNTLLAHCVGAGKTAVMITAAMELKRLRLATKTLIVVQNATLRQFAEFAPKLYPHAMILIADKKDLVKKKRKRFMSRIAVGDWDIVIMAQSSFDMVKDDPDLVMRHYESQLDELEQLIAESDNHSTIKDAERQKKQLMKMLDRLNDKKLEEDIIYFSDLGIDALIIDEAHAYKRNFFPTKMQRVKGLDRGASQRAFSLSLKIRYIMEKTGGRNIYFATGTPVTNTIAELWNMVRYISPATLEEFGIETFDRFASVFTGTETALELDAAGRFKMVQRFCKYSNVIELSKMFRTVADVVLSDDLTEVERPPIKGGHPEQINIRRGEVISQFMNYLCDFYEWYENSSDKRELSHIPLLIYGMSRKVTIDPRLIDHRFEDDPGSKLNVCTRRIHEKYHEYASIKGTQIVFCDLYRNSCDGRELFNAWEELKRKLITSGIPAGEIAIIGDYNTDKQKADLYEKVNSGEVRVVIGSTAKLGTGVNIQERLAVAHHLDCPFRPSDVEQRDGRIIRQGNILEEVEIIRYGIEQTLDAGMYAILERKQKFINDAMKGRCARTLQEINDDCALDYASFSAAISGNPKLKRKVVIETRLKELEALERQHRRNTRRRKDQEASLRQRIPAMREEIPELEKFIAAYPNLELGSLSIRYGNRELTGTLREKCEVLNRCIRNAYLAAVRECSFLNQSGSYIMEDLSIGTLEIRLIANGKITGYGKLDESESSVHYQVKGWNMPHLQTKLQGDIDDAEKLLYAIRRLVQEKPEELAKNLKELEAKTARLEKLRSTPADEFSAAAEKSSLSVELEQIIFELNKTSEGQHRRYDSEAEPNLAAYFPQLIQAASFGIMEILDGSEDTEPETALCA